LKNKETRTNFPSKTNKTIFMELGITFLGSGSSGNALVIHSPDGNGIMIDAGFSRAELISRLNTVPISPTIIKAVVLSHEHGDHTKGAKLFAEQFEIPVYATTVTARILDEKKKLPENSVLFEPGAEFEISGFLVKSFSVPHDAEETVGFVVSRNGITVGIATDLGYLTALCEQRLKGCSAIILESNHDVIMQMRSPRHIGLKRRIMGRNGHLSNDSAIEALGKIITENTQALFLVHLSEDCNDCELVKKNTVAKLAELNRMDILFGIASQTPGQTRWIKNKQE
jgi:phosphoribosyl 1,2-cyclic phosphodiesterase